MKVIKLTPVERSQEYDRLYKAGQEVLDRYNSCLWGGGNCMAGTKGCCEGCKHLGPNGCTVEALACKFWLCHEVYRTAAGRVAFEELDKLHSEARKKLGYIPIRASKQEALTAWTSRSI